MTLKNLSDKEIKTINGGSGTGTTCGWGFPLTSRLLDFTLCTLQNAKDITQTAYNGFLGLLSW